MGAISFIEHLDVHSLSVTADEFDRFLLLESENDRV